MASGPVYVCMRDGMSRHSSLVRWQLLVACVAVRVICLIRCICREKPSRFGLGKKDGSQTCLRARGERLLVAAIRICNEGEHTWSQGKGAGAKTLASTLT